MALIERKGFDPLKNIITRILFWMLVLFLGLRHEVGTDWNNYLAQFDFTRDKLFIASILRIDPGYAILNWFGANYFGSIYFVNLVSAFIFCFGLFKFSKSQPRMMLTLCTAFPYMIVVIGMGYTRQAAALGICMLALKQMFDGSLKRSALSILLASTFHSTAAIMAGFLIFAGKTKFNKKIFIAITVVFSVIFVVAQDFLSRFGALYIEVGQDSSGALVRVLMTSIPALLFLVFRKQFISKSNLISRQEKTIWIVMATCALLLFVLIFVFPSTTAIDRIAIYVMPIQLFVLSRIPDVFAGSIFIWTLVVLSYQFTILFVWLNFAVHAGDWQPYSLYF